jgi:hypothetical protein
VRQLNKASDRPPAESVAPPPGVFAKPSRSFYERRAKWPQTVAVALGIVVVGLAGYLAYNRIEIGIQNQNAASGIQRAEPELSPLKALSKQADDYRAAKEYAKAAKAYRAVIARADPVLKRLREDTGVLDPGEWKTKVEAAASELLGYIRHAQEALDAADVKNGAQGLVQTEEGQWVTPEKKKEMFLNKMKAEGRELYQGEWLTAAEIHERKGEVAYAGRWISKEEYAKILAGTGKAVAAAPPTPAAPPQPAAPPKAGAFEPSETSWVVDDFESGEVTWANVTWGSLNPTALSVVNRNDAKQLLINMKGGKFDKCAIVRRISLDLRSRTKLTMDAFNSTGEPIRVAIAVQTDRPSEFYESRWATLKTDANVGVSFDLRAGDFKSQTTNWAHATSIGRPEAVKFLYILVYSDSPGKIYLDNITILGGE